LKNTNFIVTQTNARKLQMKISLDLNGYESDSAEALTRDEKSLQTAITRLARYKEKIAATVTRIRTLKSKVKAAGRSGRVAAKPKAGKAPAAKPKAGKAPAAKPLSKRGAAQREAVKAPAKAPAKPAADAKSPAQVHRELVQKYAALNKRVEAAYKRKDYIKAKKLNAQLVELNKKVKAAMKADMESRVSKK
jgi:hypothetical protein